MAQLLTDEQVIYQYFLSRPDQCLGILYRRYVKKVFQQCLVITNDPSQAEDYTQDIFIRVLQKLDQFQMQSRFSTWLYALSYHYCVDQLRVRNRLSLSSLDVRTGWDWAESRDEHQHEETLQALQQTMAKLTADERRLLRLKYEHGFSIQELSRQYAINESAVKMRLKRYRAKAQTLFNQLY